MNTNRNNNIHSTQPSDASDAFTQWLAAEEAALAQQRGVQAQTSEPVALGGVVHYEAQEKRTVQSVSQQRIQREVAAREMQLRLEAQAQQRRLEEQARQRAYAAQQEREQRQYLAQKAEEEARQERLRQEMLAQQAKAQELARRAMRYAQEQERLRKIQEEKILAQQLELQRIAEQQRLFAQQEADRLVREAQERQKHEEVEREQQSRMFAEEAEIQKLQQDVARVLSGEEDSVKKKKKPKRPLPTSALNRFHLKDLVAPINVAFGFTPQKAAMPFVAIILIVALGIGSVSFAQKGFFLRGKVLGVSKDGYSNLTQAAENLSEQNFEGSRADFSAAYENFAKAQAELEAYGGPLIDVTRYIPALSQLSSGKNAAEAGKHIAAAGQSMSVVIQELSSVKNPIANTEQKSLLTIFNTIEKNIATAQTELSQAQANIDAVQIDDLPSDKQQAFLQLKQKLPHVLGLFDDFLDNTSIFVDLLGGNGPRKYLFLFQNNNEMRPTGGFIGSYGVLDISQGRVRNFFIDGIFNPDGQLKEKIVPPLPIQKVSVAWSLHDSNWFPDFPTSAHKAINFYEKTGGPTTDGVIAITPVVMQKLLRVTGPIEMPEYEVTLDADNFVEKTQYEVEIDYDKEENKPKKILADLAPLILDKLFSSRDGETIAKTLSVLSEGLQEKQILLYAQDERIQKKIADQGWSGEILSSQKDYISVINTNINGYKTDGVIDESIDHHTAIAQDGSLIDTVTITRKHTGGSTQYDWWNKVNADYMRVYVPQGSQLIEVMGQTRETNESPVDYDSLGFTRDPLVTKEENAMHVDPASGTRIYDEQGKTVFANWVYVSPQETVTVKYTYRLPFSLFTNADDREAIVDSYALVAQKQSGSIGSSFTKTIEMPADYAVKWSTPNDLSTGGNRLVLKNNLSVDRFVGVVFEKPRAP